MLFLAKTNGIFLMTCKSLGVANITKATYYNHIHTIPLHINAYIQIQIIAMLSLDLSASGLETSHQMI